MKYVDLGELISLDCDYNFIFSGRGPGKTDAVCREVVARPFHDHGAQFVRIARYDFDVTKSTMEGWFPQHAQDVCAADFGFVSLYKNRHYYAYYPESDKAELMGYVVPLNKQDDYKSVAFDRVENIVFEEFCAMRERDYIRGEWSLFTSALSTIVRNRQNVKCWFLGNTLTKHNPYFDVMGIDIDRLSIQPGQCRKFRLPGYHGLGATVGIMYAEMAHEDIRELSPLMRVPSNEGATSGLYMDSDEELLYRDEEIAALRTVSQRHDLFGDGWILYTGSLKGQGLYTCQVTDDACYMGTRLIILEKLPDTLHIPPDTRILDLSDGDTSVKVRDIDANVSLLPLTSRRIFWGNQRDFLELQRFIESNTLVCQDSDIRNRFKNFIDRYVNELILKV